MPGDYAIEKVPDGRNANLDAVSLLDRASSGQAKGSRLLGVGQNPQRRGGQSFEIEERLDKSVHTWLDDIAHGSDVGGQYWRAGGHRVEERPGDDERGREIDVEIAQSKDIG